jgi:hypothetical protein
MARIGWKTGLAVVAALSLLAAIAAWAQSPRPDAAPGGALFLRIAPVFEHPRCMNCHTKVDYPRQGDDRHRHAMNVRRGGDGHGAAAMRCTACHGRGNNAVSGVPGADEDWHLAPLSMGWEGLAAGEICRNLADPAKNGGRTGSQVVDHLNTPLVRWAWSPGQTAQGAARTSPPLSHADFVAAAQAWITAGAPCP